MTYFFGAILIGAPVVLNETLALMSGVANGVSASRGVRPTKGWLALGYATNSISVIGGAAMMVAGFLSKGSVQTGYDKSGYPVYGYDYKTDGTLVGIGSALFAIGGMGLGFTIWGHSKPKNPGLNLTVKPIAGFGARGEFFAGASLELAGF
ncbi:MAG: hypothetical protein HYY84_02305 [Deltaproteobacteria bacterium]|nr:hypothetical protein [Deltaproteobacteria bacterium]